MNERAWDSFWVCDTSDPALKLYKRKTQEENKMYVGPKGPCFFKKLLEVLCSSTISTIRFRSSPANCCPNEQRSLNNFYLAPHQ